MMSIGKHSNMWTIVSLLVSICVLVECNDNLRVAYEWREIDFEYRSVSDRNEAIESKAFVPANVIPVGLEVYQTRLFITLPRWKRGVPASLAYIDINGKCFIVLMLHNVRAQCNPVSIIINLMFFQFVCVYMIELVKQFRLFNVLFIVVVLYISARYGISKYIVITQ